MSTTRKVAIGLGIAGGALLAAWLFTGNRKKKTKDFVIRKASDIRRTLQANRTSSGDTHAHYI